MKKFVVLIVSRYDHYDRTWVTRPTLEEAKKVAFEYTKDNHFNIEIYELGAELS